SWQTIPDSVISQLEQLINQLPYPSSRITVIEETIISHLKEWEADQKANHLVILGLPVTNLTDLIPASFPKEHLKNIEVIYPLFNL
ncbi:hypothetical protein, partial [Burkholderia sp. SIMBA_024]|uniref:hypothetical protein n=1 Tax=Burkholderia sp. SIMBA_024 TaxID=3085768 RepID=UPI00397800DB